MPWTYPEQFDVIVVGAGHAGCEAALAAARMGCKTLLLTMNLDTIAKMSCNPAIGGVAKGHLVREIDALGGEMGKVIDQTGIQFRMLNASKGPAVWSPRAQADRIRYQFEMKKRLEKCPNLYLHQGTTEKLLSENDQIIGVESKENIRYLAKTVILSSGTFMSGTIHIGETKFSGGRTGDQAAQGISQSLRELGFDLGSLKTGTPPRVLRRSIDLSQMEEQPPEYGIFFSHENEGKDAYPMTQVSCYIAYTNENTKAVIQKNLNRSAMYSGAVQSVGPRYCPSIEDKIVRFADKERHQIFIEPEGLDTQELYINGISTSLPFDVQLEMIHSIKGMENAQITRPAYAIEYDYVTCGQIKPSLESKKVEGLFFAGQINGTTGYEEAAAQGLLAGINAANKVNDKQPLILARHESYMGVLIDDLVTQEFKEPYRVFTSRAEHRLILRQDNAEYRLSHYGYTCGLISKERFELVSERKKTIEQEIQRLEKTFIQESSKGLSMGRLLSRPEMSYEKLLQEHPDRVFDHGKSVNFQLELHFRYAGYLERQEREIARLSQVENVAIPESFDFSKVVGLRNEAKEKLQKVNPTNLGQASRIAGVSPADISILMVLLRQSSRTSAATV